MMIFYEVIMLYLPLVAGTGLPSHVQSVNMCLMSSDMNEMDVASSYRLMKLIQERPEISQRELAKELGLSLGKVNYCLKAFISKGWVKANNFRRSDNKRAYAYLLTPHGIEEKARVTAAFFHRIESEYESLKLELELIEKKRTVSEGNSARNGVGE